MFDQVAIVNGVREVQIHFTPDMENSRFDLTEYEIKMHAGQVISKKIAGSFKKLRRSRCQVAGTHYFLYKMFDVFRRKSVSSDTQKAPTNTGSKRRNSKSTYLTYSPSATVDYNSEMNRLDQARMAAGIMRCNRL